MPTIISKSNIRAVSEHCSLVLNIKHHLAVEVLPEIRQFSTKTRLPDEIDVLGSPSIVIAFSGIFNSSAVPASDVATSYAAVYFANFLRMNATELGLNAVSTVHIDPKDDTPKLYFTSTRSLPLKPEILPVHATLVQIDIQYVWRAPLQSQSDEGLHSQSCDHPFAMRLTLPFCEVLYNVIKRCVVWQLVRRYPLIFGAWCQQLQLERRFFPAIFSSIRNIRDRSDNPTFRARCQRLFKSIRQQHGSARREAMAALSSYSGCDPLPTTPADAPPLTDEDSLCLSMESMYKSSARKPQFQGLGDRPTISPPDDDELSQEHPTHAQDSAIRIDEDLLWQEHSAQAQSGSSPVSHFTAPLSMSPLICSEMNAKKILEADSDSDSDGFDFEETSNNFDLDINYYTGADDLQHWLAAPQNAMHDQTEEDDWRFYCPMGMVENNVNGVSRLKPKDYGLQRHYANLAINDIANSDTNRAVEGDQSPDQRCSQEKKSSTHMADLVSTSNPTNPNSPDPPFLTTVLDTSTGKHQVTNGYTPEHATVDQTMTEALAILEDLMDPTDTLGSWCSDDTYLNLSSESDSDLDIQITPEHLALEDLGEAIDVLPPIVLGRDRSHPGFALPPTCSPELIDHAMQECGGECEAGEPMDRKRPRGDTLDDEGVRGEVMTSNNDWSREESLQFELIDFGGDW